MKKKLRKWWLCFIRHEHIVSVRRDSIEAENYCCLRCYQTVKGLWQDGRFYQDVFKTGKEK